MSSSETIRRNTAFGAKHTNHTKLNDNLGVADHPATKALDGFAAGILR